MNKYFRCTGYLLLLFLLLLTASCGTSDEVRTVEGEPRSSADRTVDEEADTTEQFMQLTVGLLEPVDNFDPLFINNQSAMRTLSLIYDGLFTVDADGNIMEAIARDVTVSDDSLTYQVEINTDLFYHDNTAFMSGIGRRIQADDIKWAFERAARLEVPDRAAHLLMNIEGYEEYFEDQRFTYDPDRRAMQEVSGIIVVNPREIRFRLIESDPDFLKKLASPYLFIYPREAVEARGRSLKTNPVGTGAYRFTDQNENTITLTLDQSEQSGNRLISPRLNRIDLVHYSRESELFQEFALQNIDWIPEMGPDTRRVALTPDNQLTPGYSQDYKSHQSGTRLVNVYLNNNTRRVNMNWLRSRLSGVNPDSIRHSGSISIVNPVEAPADSAGNPDSTYLVTYSSDPNVRSLLSDIQETFLVPDSEFRLMDIRTTISRAALFTESTNPFHEQFSENKHRIWLQYMVDNFGLYHMNIEGIVDTEVSWKLFPEEIRIQENSGDAP